MNQAGGPPRCHRPQGRRGCRWSYPTRGPFGGRTSCTPHPKLGVTDPRQGQVNGREPVTFGLCPEEVCKSMQAPSSQGTADGQPARPCQGIRTHRHLPGEVQRRSTKRPCRRLRRQGSQRLHPQKFNSQGVSQLLLRDNFITAVTLQSASLTDQNDCASTAHKSF